MALGADRWRILAMLTADSVRVASAGAVGGLVFFFAAHSMVGWMFFEEDASNPVSGILVGVSRTDPLVLAAALALIATVLATTLLASLAATRVEPAEATRL
jgi:ABC-type antimicrobial peptide transport system permease subunit